MAKTTIDPAEKLWAAHIEERPRESWASTDPAQISQHDRPSPYAQPSPVVVRSEPPPPAFSLHAQARGPNQLASPGLPAIVVPPASAPKQR